MWKNAWQVDNEEWRFTSTLFDDVYYLNMTIESTEQHLAWWEVSNLYPEYYICICVRTCRNWCVGVVI